MSIVVGFIDTPEGYAALKHGIEEATLRGARLIVVNSKVGGSHEETEEYTRIEEISERLEEQLKSSGIDYEFHEYVRGNTPADDIKQAVVDLKADMIVIGLRDRSKAAQVLLGSNTLDILRNTSVPVLCAKPTSSEEAPKARLESRSR